jgi:hypothetical protein
MCEAMEPVSMSNDHIRPTTASVFEGGGSFGAIQVDMLHALA